MFKSICSQLVQHSLNFSGRFQMSQKTRSAVSKLTSPLFETNYGKIKTPFNFITSVKNKSKQTDFVSAMTKELSRLNLSLPWL